MFFFFFWIQMKCLQSVFLDIKTKKQKYGNTAPNLDDSQLEYKIS